MQDFFFIRHEGRFQKVRMRDVLYIEGCLNHVKIFTERKTYIPHAKMSQMENLLDNFGFCRVHRSFIVSLQHIDNFDLTTITIREHAIPIGRYYRNKFMESVNIVVCENYDSAVNMAKSMLKVS